MGIIKEVLEKEFKRLKSLSEKYGQNISRFPAGSVSIKKISGHKYASRAQIKGKKILFEYVGKASNPEVRSLQADIKNDKRSKTNADRSMKT